MKNLVSKSVALVGASSLAGSVLATPVMAAATVEVDITSPAETASTVVSHSSYFMEQMEPNFEGMTKNLSDEELALLKSGEPAVIYQKAETAEITKVVKAGNAQTYGLHTN